MCTTKRTSGWSIPIPKATVATITDLVPTMQRVRLSADAASSRRENAPPGRPSPQGSLQVLQMLCECSQKLCLYLRHPSRIQSQNALHPVGLALHQRRDQS